MPQRKRHLPLLLALPILLTLAATPAGALPLDRALPDLFARGWSLFSSLWSDFGDSVDPGNAPGSGAPRPIFGEAGCMIDPHGGCATSTAVAPIFSEAGCSVDPFGRCQQ